MSRFGGQPVEESSTGRNRFGGEPLEGTQAPSTATVGPPSPGSDDDVKSRLNFAIKERKDKLYADEQTRLAAKRVGTEFDSQTLERSTIKPLTDAEYAKGEKAHVIASHGAGERFGAGAKVVGSRFGRGVASTLGYDELVDKYDTEIAGWSKTARGTAGTLGELAASAPMFVAAGLTGPASVVALGTLFMSGFGNSMADSAGYEKENDVAIPYGDRLLTAIGHGALDTAFAKLGASFGLQKVLLRQVPKDVVKALGQKLVAGNVKEAVSLAGKSLVPNFVVHSAEGAAMMAAYQAGMNTITKQGYDPNKEYLEGVGEAAAMGFLLSGTTSVAGAAIRGAKWEKRFEQTKKTLLDEGLVHRDEMIIIGDNTKKLYEVAKARRNGDIVQLDTSKPGEVGVSATPDVLSWGQKKALGNNETVIAEVREQILKGKIKPEDIFETPELGPVRAEEVAALQTRLKALADEIKLDPTKEFDPQHGIPTTRRALLQGDVDLISKRLEDEWTKPVGRNLVEQAKALLETSRREKLAASTDPVPITPGVLGPRREILTQIDLVPPSKVKLQVELAKASGYLESPEKLTDNLRIRKRLGEAQTKLLRQVFALRKDVKLPVDERYTLGKALETDFIARAERLLKRDDNTANGAKAQVTRAVATSKLANKTSVVDQVTTAIDEITKRHTNLTQRETVARLIDEFESQIPSDGPVKSTPKALLLIKELYAKMNSDAGYQPWGDKVRQGLVQTQILSRVVFDKVKRLEQENRNVKTVAGLIQTLPNEFSQPLLSRLSRVETGAELNALIVDVIEAQKLYLQTSSINKIIKMSRALDKNPKRTEGFDLVKGRFTDLETKPVSSRAERTARENFDLRKLQARLKELEPDALKSLENDLTRLTRKGEIERGLYAKWLKYRTTEDVKNALASIKNAKIRGGIAQRLDTPSSVARLIYDPVSTEGWLYQLVRGDTNSAIYKILVEDFKDPYSRSVGHSASSRRYMRDKAQEIYGFSTETSRGEWKFVRYMTQRLPSGIQRDEAMWAYALYNDLGRRQALKEAGIETRGKKFDLETVLRQLSDKDKKFVDESKRFFLNNPFVERAFNEYTLLNGIEAERSPGGWFTSRRDYEPTREPKDFNEYELHILRSTDALRSRVEGAKKPFKLDGGFVSAFNQVSDQLANYAEMGRGLNRAGRLMIDPAFRKDFVARFGESKYKELTLYWQNKMGVLGQNPSALDAVVGYLTHANVAAKIGLNVWSASKQLLSLFTTLGDDVISRPALLKAMGEGSIARGGIDERMLANSPIAFMRLRGGRFSEQLLVLGHHRASPRLAFLQDKAFVLQKFVDQRTLRVVYRAAELMAQERGLKGAEARAFIVDKFETALTRAQTSDSPIYAQQLELLAKNNKLLLGSLTFRRELNRIYNTVRRHVVRAVQDPTPENLRQAGYSLFFSGIANTGAEVGINALRVAAYGLPALGVGKLAGQYLANLAGQWYLAGDVVKFFEGLFDDKSRDVSERDLGVIPSLTRDGYKAAWAVADFTSADGEITRGIHRGESKELRATTQALESGISAVSTALGMPFWALYSQGKGLYNWKREDYRLMVHLETEYHKLKGNEEKNSDRLREIGRVRERVNRIHQRRERGMMTKEEARRDIISELRDGL